MSLPSALCWVLLLWLVPTATSHVSPTAAAASSGDEWHDLSNFSSISLERYHQLHQLYRRLGAPKSKSFLDWRQRWPEQRTTISVDYGGKHPFEQPLHRRRTQSSSSYQPIRISYVTAPLTSGLGVNSETDARINFVLSTVLPQVQSTWSSYLKVIPTTQPIAIDSNVCFGLFQDTIPASVLQNGVANADLVIIVTSNEIMTAGDGTSIDFCGTGTLAVSVLCAQDQHDRPIVGLMNFCPSNITSTSSQRQRRQTRQRNQHHQQRRRMQTTNDHLNETSTPVVISSWPRQFSLVSKRDETLVAIHELGHTLGMNSDLYPYFRNATTGEPLTPRPIVNQKVTCTGASQTTQFVPLPASNTIQMGTTSRGSVYYDIVTPRVRTVARNQFNCQSLRGARIESQDTSSSCIGSHWDQRLFFSELMGAIYWGTSDVLSPLTLALMEDSGWYQVEYGNAQLSPFGQGVGCDFVNGDCIVNDAVPDYGRGYFCSEPTTVQSNGAVSVVGTDLFCDPSHYEWAVCDLFDLQSIPSAFVQKYTQGGTPIQYFSNPNLVGVVPQPDYCPMPLISVQVACTDSSTQKITTYQGEAYGSDSRCINAHFTTSTGIERQFPGCFSIVCDANAFQVVVNGVACQYDFQEITIYAVNSQPATMICPRLATICPDLFCPGDCSGKGVCDYTQRPPVCQCFDSSDTSSDCGNSGSRVSAVSPTPPPTFTRTPPPSRLPTTPSPTNFPTLHPFPGPTFPPSAAATPGPTVPPPPTPFPTQAVVPVTTIPVTTSLPVSSSPTPNPTAEIFTLSPTTNSPISTSIPTVSFFFFAPVEVPTNANATSASSSSTSGNEPPYQQRASTFKPSVKPTPRPTSEPTVIGTTSSASYELQGEPPIQHHDHPFSPRGVNPRPIPILQRIMRSPLLYQPTSQ